MKTPTVLFYRYLLGRRMVDEINLSNKPIWLLTVTGHCPDSEVSQLDSPLARAYSSRKSRARGTNPSMTAETLQ
jgi:hypothetical protein